ncbi:unnamed protein product (macronuclear) [Paramecium tetraurelia]|uniref:Uncharacterized protein n=1 Tax=Paramecium tetraurelia TaxID=5888 RepID=A0ECW4_PARTE|nr:uncharacterized protein GSPATT00004000001 [Paramecium tetraurelia]CAK93131.1 unnamed protein product [Paramecium tetraurelia]|eukprot:XP_001460528.1 hypothetical protein (macronuclear) [Paramecium tetraurelia strain d4-2]
MNQQCPHCRRRLPIPSSITKPRSQKKQNVTQTLKNISLYDLLEEFAKVRSEQHFDLMQFLQEKIKNPELTDDYYPVTQRKKWDLPKKQ